MLPATPTFHDIIFLQTERLLIMPLNLHEDAFVFRLVNTAGWLQYIGSRNINTIQDAQQYISKNINNDNANFWVVRLKETNESIGIITFIQRTYLSHRDIGFAFLPEYMQYGYAFESVSAVIRHIAIEHQPEIMFATTVPENNASKKLLEKLGFIYENELAIEQKTVHLYNIDLKKFK